MIMNGRFEQEYALASTAAMQHKRNTTGSRWWPYFSVPSGQ